MPKTKPLTFKLKFKPSDIKPLAARYLERNATRPIEDQDVSLTKVAKAAKARGYLQRDEFLKFCRWKSPRIMKHAASNSTALVEEASAVAFAAKTEEMRIGALMVLNGVLWPVASSILHWVYDSRYPLLDFRALWSLGVEKVPTYDHTFWNAYTTACRAIAKEAGVTLRDLDRALWQYSFENQPPQSRD